VKLIQRIFFTIIFMFANTVIAQQSSLSNPQEPKQFIIDGIVAIVNNDIILRSEVMFLLEQNLVANKIDLRETPEKFDDIYEMTLQGLINMKIEVAQANEDTLIIITDEEVEQAVDQRINEMIRNEGSERAIEEKFSVTIKRIKEILTSQARNQMLVNRLRQKKMSAIAVSRNEIETFYETFKDSLPVVPETYDISHILRTPVPGGEIARQKHALLDSLRQLIINGADFAELAKEYSEDYGSKDNGGAYGWIEYGDFVEEFEEAVKNIEPGEVSEIVQTSYGMHLIRVLEKRPGSYRPQHILLLIQATEDDAEQTVEFLNGLRERALAGEDFGELSVEYSDDAQIRKDKGYIGNFPLQQIAQFEPAFVKVIQTLKADEISRPFQTQFGYHILKLNKVSQEKKLTLQEDYDTIKAYALQQKQQVSYNNWLQEVKEEMYIDIKPSLNFQNKK